MPVSIENILNLIAKKEYGKAECELKKAIAFFPNEDALYRLFAYCEDCIKDICKNEEFDVDSSDMADENKLELWQKMHPQIEEDANNGKYKKALNLLRLLKDSAKLEINNVFSNLMANPSTIFMEEAAKCSFLMGDMEEAKRLYQDSLKEEIKLRGANSYLSVPYLVKLEKYNEAFNVIQASLANALPQDLPDILYARYQIFEEIGDEKNAKQTLHLAIDSLQNDLKMRPLLSCLYKKHAAWLIELDAYEGPSCGDIFLEKALLENAKAISLCPRYRAYHLQRARIFAHLGQKENALKELALIEKKSLFYTGYYSPIEKGKVYEFLADFKTAEKCYKQKSVCLEKYYDNLYDFYRRLGEQEKAKKVRQKQRKEARFQDRVSKRELLFKKGEKIWNI